MQIVGAFKRKGYNGRPLGNGGIVSERPFPVYPEGFPQELIDSFSNACGRGVICNKPYSGTEVIKDFGEEHIKTGKLIVYTSRTVCFRLPHMRR